MTNRSAAILIIKTLRKHGFQSLLAGGCVRDMLLRVRASDYDVATNAAPAEVLRVFRRTIKVGARFGVVIVRIENQQVEVATFRMDVNYTDGRRPDQVKFTTAREDALRRDFTVNGMFYDPVKREVIDYVNGRADLKERVIRTIGSAQERFSEDYLRMLRAVRFSARLDFAIDPETLASIKENAHKISAISRERITMELQGILTNEYRVQGVNLLIKTTLAEYIFPGLDIEQFKGCLNILAGFKKKADFILVLAGLFACCETSAALNQIRTLKLSRNQLKKCTFLLTNRGILLTDMSIADLKLMAYEQFFEDLYELQRVIQRAKGDSIAQLTNLRKRLRDLGDIDLHPDPLIDGHALMDLGVPAGPLVGRLAQQMYKAQLEGVLTSVGDARDWVKNKLSEVIKEF